jgi:hypothetical protein
LPVASFGDLPEQFSGLGRAEISILKTQLDLPPLLVIHDYDLSEYQGGPPSGDDHHGATNNLKTTVNILSHTHRLGFLGLCFFSLYLAVTYLIVNKSNSTLTTVISVTYVERPAVPI